MFRIFYPELCHFRHLQYLLVMLALLLVITPLSAQNKTIKTAVLSGEAVFDYNTFTLSQQGVLTLNRLIDQLSIYEQVESVRIVGHTDDRGSAEYNRILSERRARYIAHLFKQRFQRSDIIVVGAGESTPIASNETAEGRQRNRRVEIQVIVRGVPADG